MDWDGTDRARRRYFVHFDAADKQVRQGELLASFRGSESETSG
jgi:hypothetical protein